MKREEFEGAPTPKGKPVTMTAFQDSSLYHCKLTGRAVTGIIHMINKTPFEWYTKRQNTVETATYSAEFVSAKQCVEQIIGMRYEVAMMGIPIDGPTWMFGDNEGVIKSSTHPDATIKRRNIAMAFHYVREAIASKVIYFIHMPGELNPADALTKFLSGTKWWSLLKPLLHWLPKKDD